MIQRIQSVWLLVATILSAGLFMFGMMNVTYIQNGEEISKTYKLLEYSYLLAVVAIALVALPLIAIFMFKNRKMQVNLALLALVLNIGFVAFYLMGTDSFVSKLKVQPTGTSFGVASFIPLVSVIFLFMAIRGIRKDEKLVKSLDRLR